MEKSIFTIGYGNRTIDEFLSLLQKYNINFLIDVRSMPYSKFHNLFNKEQLSLFAKNRGIKYSFWGKELGGRPSDESLYYDDGKVNYNRIKEEKSYINSIERLTKAVIDGHRIALMCSELNPEECHRSKLIGESLNLTNKISVNHIGGAGSILQHSDVILKVTKGVNSKDLFGHSTLSSNGTYTDEITNIDFFTIGVYNSSAETFFEKLTNNKIDTFIDVRQRRGVRGAKYSFVNKNQLKNKLKLLGIDYLYFRDLAPTNSIREKQKESDIRNKTTKKKRQFLGSTFTREYEENILNNFDFPSFLKTLKSTQVKKAVLFCVEEKHTACHRSLIANKLLHIYNYNTRHL